MDPRIFCSVKFFEPTVSEMLAFFEFLAIEPPPPEVFDFDLLLLPHAASAPAATRTTSASSVAYQRCFLMWLLPSCSRAGAWPAGPASPCPTSGPAGSRRAGFQPARTP